MKVWWIALFIGLPLTGLAMAWGLLKAASDADDEMERRTECAAALLAHQAKRLADCEGAIRYLGDVQCFDDEDLEAWKKVRRS